MIRGKRLSLILAGTLALGIGLWLGHLLTRPPAELPAISGIFFPKPQKIEDFTLIDQTGQPFHRDRFQGKWTFLYFGYTYCPDACPLTLAKLAKMQQQLEQQAQDKDNAYWFISVDPERDTPQRLGEYAAYFAPKFRGATGTAEELAKLAKQLGVIYQRSPDQAGKTNYTVDHSSTVIVIDPEVRLHAIFTPPQTPETMAADFSKILEHYRASQ